MAYKIPVKGNDGFFLQVDKIFLDLLHCTDLNIYGILILAQIYEFKRNKKPCIMSTPSFCDLFKTSSYTIEKQLNILYDLGLVHKTIKTNQKNTVSRVRHLTIPQDFAKILENLLKNKDNKQTQNLGVASSKKSQSNPKNLGYQQPLNLGVPSSKQASNFGVASEVEATLNFDDKQPLNSHESNPKIHTTSNPKIRPYNNIKDTDTFNEIRCNNKLLEDNTSSPTSSDDDSVASKDAPLKDALQDILIELNGTELDTNNNTNNDTGDEISMPRYSNQKNEEITAWFYTLNPISRYTYELKYKGAAKNFAWGEKDKPENQPDYYTPSQIIEYFTLEGKLDYLREIEWEHSWMI